MAFSFDSRIRYSEVDSSCRLSLTELCIRDRVEAGFTRAKNTGNILMKNLMDFCIGTVVFLSLIHI